MVHHLRYDLVAVTCFDDPHGSLAWSESWYAGFSCEVLSDMRNFRIDDLLRNLDIEVLFALTDVD